MEKLILGMLLLFCITGCSDMPEEASISSDCRTNCNRKCVSVTTYEVDGEQYLIFRDHMHGGIAVTPKIKN